MCIKNKKTQKLHYKLPSYKIRKTLNANSINNFSYILMKSSDKCDTGKLYLCINSSSWSHRGETIQAIRGRR